MDGLTERDRQEFALVEDAMRSYPLADTPPDFAGAVMSRVRASVLAPRFRVTWREALISLFIPCAGIFGLIFWASLPPQGLAYIQTRLLLLWHFLQRSGLDWVVFASGAAIVAAMVWMIFLMLKPHFRRPRVMPIIPIRYF